MSFGTSSSFVAEIVEREDSGFFYVLFRVFCGTTLGFLLPRRALGKASVLEDFRGGSGDIVRAMAFLRDALRKRLEVS